jgi:hypothetical protein
MSPSQPFHLLRALFILAAALAAALAILSVAIFFSGSSSSKPTPSENPAPSIASSNHSSSEEATAAPVLFPTVAAPVPKPTLPVTPPLTPEEEEDRRFEVTGDPGWEKALLPNDPDFQVRPFAVSQASAHHEWTAEDGRSPAAMDKLAHNPLERERLTDENEYVTRRQLVYRKHPLPEIGMQSFTTGEQVKTLTLPDFNGRDLEVVITESKIEWRGKTGFFRGYVKGDPEATVAASYYQGAECFEIQRGSMILAGDPREPGQVVLKEVDPRRMPAMSSNPVDIFDVGEPLSAKK